MEPKKGRKLRFKADRLKSTSVETTLYDLIKAVQEALPPGQEKMVTRVVCRLLSRNRSRFLNVPGKYANTGFRHYRPTPLSPAVFLETAG
jgi:hypothetical protein